MSANLAPLPFGIPALDKLLGYENFDLADIGNCLSVPTSLTLVGRDGTGKSVFALHLAAAYHAIRHRHNLLKKPLLEQPLVVYVSTDLRHSGAQSIWDNFFLSEPWRRYVPFISADEIRFRRDLIDGSDAINAGTNIKVTLRDCQPGILPDELPLTAGEGEARVLFVDLSETTTGDDWLFVNRLASSVSRRKESPPNLLVIDSVAGFQTLVGERDSFGEAMTRRARIAQLLRAAARSWHTVLVVEEPESGKHHPEEYVTDTVIHLRRQGETEKSRRTLEIEKSRARSFASGEHPFEIRDGFGTSTGTWENPDDPRTFRRPEVDEGPGQDCNAYVQVFPSLHFWSKDLARRTSIVLARETMRNPKVERENVPFGITYLDDMLATEDKYGRRGLPMGSVSCLVGDEGTLKVALAEQFLQQSFEYIPHLLDLVLHGVSKWAHFGWAKDINEVLAGLPDTDGNLISKIASPARDRIRKALHNWLKEYPTRQKRLRDFFDGGPQDLLGEAALKESLRSWGGSPKHHRPLVPRWDEYKLYYAVREVCGDKAKYPLALAMAVLRIASGLISPVVYISCHDTSAEVISRQILDVLEGDLRKVVRDRGCDYDEKFVDALSRLLERFIIVRRIELIDATGPQLWHTIYGCVNQALFLMGNDASLLEKTEASEFAGSIRFVLNDLRLIRDTYPAVSGDSLFLPTIVFRLRRMGVTALIVDSENGRPDTPPTSSMNGALRSLVDHQIYTWKVPFFGEERVAISVIPPLPGNAAGIIRELRYQEPGRKKMKGRIEVDPHFSLYMGVEEGRPSAVPLQVILYAETPAFADYIETEQRLFSHIFSAQAADKQVIRVEKTRDYDGLRDYCHVSTDTRLPFTLVFAVDEFWALGREASIRDESEYLYDKIRPESGSRAPEADYVDRFRLFRRTRQRIDHSRTKRSDAFKQRDGNTTYYESGLPDDLKKADYRIDRIPFTWDFGFLLCDEAQWTNALDVTLKDSTAENPLKVEHIWKRLTGAAGDITPVSWRDFFEACLAVSEVESRRTEKETSAFDLATATPESLSCSLLEIWLSEIANDAIRLKSVAPQWAKDAGDVLSRLTGVDRWASESNRLYLQDLISGSREGVGSTSEAYEKLRKEWKNSPSGDGDAAYADVVTKLPGYSLQLYKTWLLLLEVLNFRRYRDSARPFELKSDYEPSRSANAARHWYKTACAATWGEEAFRSEDGRVSNRVAARLPGHFSVRGDWFLAVAKGSRSYSLADRALDLLSSRRANRSRLQMGLGLPTRDILAGPTLAKMRTRLSALGKNQVRRDIYYGELLALGGIWTDKSLLDEKGFRWVRRSAFCQFDRQSRVVQRWIDRMLAWTAKYRDEHTGSWRQSAGFDGYDEINRGNLANVKDFDSFVDFAKGLDLLVEDLDSASRFDHASGEEPAGEGPEELALGAQAGE